MPQAPHHKTARKHQRWSVFLWTFIAVFVISQFDVLGIYESLVPLSEKIMSRVTAPWHSDKGQQNITVVLIDKEFMNRVGGGEKGWPLAADTFINDVLQPVADAGAKAIFIDIVFTDMPRPAHQGKPADGDTGIVDLANGVRDISRNVPVFVADTLNITSAEDAGCVDDWIDIGALGNTGTLSARFRNIAFGGAHTHLEAVAANWLDDGTQYPIDVAVASNKSACTAVVNAMPSLLKKPAGDVAGGYLLSPAAAIYSLYCRDSHGACPGIKPLGAAAERSGYKLYALDDDLRHPMLAQWGTRQSAQMQADFAQAVKADECIAQNTTSWPYETMIQSLHVILPVLDRVFKSPDRACPYIDTLPADMVLEPERYFSSENPDAMLKRYFRGRTVMIGTDLPYARDRIVSPVGGEVPGVYLHAMALDNLIDKGSNYQRRPDEMEDVVQKIVEALLVALAAITLPGALATLFGWKWIASQIDRSIVWRFALFFAAFAASLVLVFPAAVILAAALRGLAHIVINPVFVALAVEIALSEDLRREIFPHSEAHRAGPRGTR